MKKTLVFFDGNGCVSKAAKALGDDVKANDILPLSHIDLPMDIMNFHPNLLGSWIPDRIHFSPPCETLSMVTARKGGGNLYYQTIKKNNRVIDIFPRTDFTQDKRFKNITPEQIKKIQDKQKQHAAFIDKVIEIIKHYKKLNPKLIWFIENPASGLIRHYLKGKIDGLIENKTTYCMYGAEYRKETSIFSNVKLDLKYCPKHKEGVTDLCGGHKDSLVQRYDDKKQPKGVVTNSTYLDRSSIPHELCIDFLTQSETVFHIDI